MTTYPNIMKHKTVKYKTVKQKTIKCLMAVAFLGLLSFATIPQAQAEDCSPIIYNGLLGPKFKKVGESNGETIYACMRDDKPYPKITVKDINIIAGGSQAVGMGNAQKVVDFGVSRVDVDGFDMSAVNVPSSYIFKKAGSITEPLNETFQFFTYTDNNGGLITSNGSSDAFKRSYCQGKQTPPYGAVNHWQNIVDYLTDNAQKFFVNGEPAVSDYKKIDNNNHQIATKTLVVDATQMTVNLIARKKDSFYYSFANKDSIYCMMTVGVEASVDLNTARAKGYTLNISYNSN